MTRRVSNLVLNLLKKLTYRAILTLNLNYISLLASFLNNKQTRQHELLYGPPVLRLCFFREEK
jgi:hypothetical protein